MSSHLNRETFLVIFRFIFCQNLLHASAIRSALAPLFKFLQCGRRAFDVHLQRAVAVIACPSDQMQILCLGLCFGTKTHTLHKPGYEKVTSGQS